MKFVRFALDETWLGMVDLDKEGKEFLSGVRLNDEAEHSCPMSRWAEHFLPLQHHIC